MTSTKNWWRNYIKQKAKNLGLVVFEPDDTSSLYIQVSESVQNNERSVKMYKVNIPAKTFEENQTSKKSSLKHTLVKDEQTVLPLGLVLDRTAAANYGGKNETFYYLVEMASGKEFAVTRSCYDMLARLHYRYLHHIKNSEEELFKQAEKV